VADPVIDAREAILKKAKNEPESELGKAVSACQDAWESETRWKNYMKQSGKEGRMPVVINLSQDIDSTELKHWNNDIMSLSNASQELATTRIAAQKRLIELATKEFPEYAKQKEVDPRGLSAVYAAVVKIGEDAQKSVGNEIPMAEAPESTAKDKTAALAAAVTKQYEAKGFEGKELKEQVAATMDRYRKDPTLNVSDEITRVEADTRAREALNSRIDDYVANKDGRPIPPEEVKQLKQRFGRENLSIEQINKLDTKAIERAYDRQTIDAARAATEAAKAAEAHNEAQQKQIETQPSKPTVPAEAKGTVSKDKDGPTATTETQVTDTTGKVVDIKKEVLPSQQADHETKQPAAVKGSTPPTGKSAER
jgi:hypothetical protein